MAGKCSPSAGPGPPPPEQGSLQEAGREPCGWETLATSAVSGLAPPGGCGRDPGADWGLGAPIQPLSSCSAIQTCSIRFQAPCSQTQCPGEATLPQCAGVRARASTDLTSSLPASQHPCREKSVCSLADAETKVRAANGLSPGKDEAKLRSERSPDCAPSASWGARLARETLATKGWLSRWPGGRTQHPGVVVLRRGGVQDRVLEGQLHQEKPTSPSGLCSAPGRPLEHADLTSLPARNASRGKVLPPPLDSF